MNKAIIIIGLMYLFYLHILALNHANNIHIR